MDMTEHGGGLRVTAAPVRRPPRPAGRRGSGTRSGRSASLLAGAVSVALLGATLLLAAVCLVLPKALGAVPLTILSGSMAPAMPPGTLAVVRPLDATRARVGDVLTYQPVPDDPTLVTHRVVAVSRNADGVVRLTMQGDANRDVDPDPVGAPQVRGSVVYAVPYVGWVTTWLNVGAGATLTPWAAYALIGVGSTRILLGVGGPTVRNLVRGPGARRRTSHPPTTVVSAPRSPTVVHERVSVPGGRGTADEGDRPQRSGSTSPASDLPAHGRPAPLRRQRQALTVGAVAARIEHRLPTTEQTRRGLRDGCELALRHGLSAVVVPPVMVPQVGPQLAGTPVGLVALLGWRDGEVETLEAAALRAQACRLVADGATDVAVLADADRLAADAGRRFARELTALVEVVQARGARVRVVLDTAQQTPAATAAACERLGATGAWLVQGGSSGGARTGLSRIQLMRANLPAEVRLKWALPIRTLDSMMIGIAEGVDVFDGDPTSLLAEAADRISTRPLLVPVRGVDY